MELFSDQKEVFMFADSAKIYIRSGKGGDGHVSFRRELFVAAGGPDGGDGGRGGDVIFEVDDGLNTLTDFRHVRKYVAGDGEQGGKRRCHGADGEDLIVKVPEGTVIKDFESGKVIADMSGENRREVILKGGKGGLGNMHFATSTMQVPKYAQPGQPAQELWVQLELKVIADVGLVLSIWRRKSCPRPIPWEAPSMSPGISAMTKPCPSCRSTTPRCGFSVVKW